MIKAFHYANDDFMGLLKRSDTRNLSMHFYGIRVWWGVLLGVIIWRENVK